MDLLAVAKRPAAAPRRSGTGASALKPELRRGRAAPRRCIRRDERRGSRRARRPRNRWLGYPSPQRHTPRDLRTRRIRTSGPVHPLSSASRRRSLARPGSARSLAPCPHDDRRTGCRGERPRAPGARLHERHDQAAGAAGAADTRENPHPGPASAARRGPASGWAGPRRGDREGLRLPASAPSPHLGGTPRERAAGRSDSWPSTEPSAANATGRRASGRSPAGGVRRAPAAIARTGIADDSYVPPSPGAPGGRTYGCLSTGHRLGPWLPIRRRARGGQEIPRRPAAP